MGGTFLWLLRLRWGAVVAQAVFVLAADRFSSFQLPVGRLLAVLAIVAASNAILSAYARGREIPRALPTAVLALDVVALTAMLWFTGGPLNPFTSLYLVNIALAAAVLDGPATWTVVVLSTVCFGALFVDSAYLNTRLDGADHAMHMRLHLKGMWLSFMVAALFIGYFVRRVQRELELEREALTQLRAQRARGEKLAALATLATGAAHELATPLSTIAVVARELERRLETMDAGLAEDARLVREQCTRCRAVLDQLSADAGGGVADETRPVAVEELLAMSVEGLRSTPPVSTAVDASLVGRALVVPPRSLAMALRGVVKNAQDASDTASMVRVSARATSNSVELLIEDRGPGMSKETLAHAGEPFFTTKEPGAGMGLGLFLTRTVLEQLEGAVAIDSKEGEGTVVRLVLPRTVLA